MKLFLVALLSGSCLYGMEDNDRNQLKKSQEIPKCIFYYDSPCGNPIIVGKNDFYYKPQTNISLTSSLTFVPSQLIGAIVISKEAKNKENNNNE